MEKYEIIRLKINGWKDKRIHDVFGVSRDTIRKYWNDYQSNLSLLMEGNPNIDTHKVIETLVSDPKYDVSGRKSRKYNEKIDECLDKILEDEDKKKERLGKRNKQMLTKTQIYELIKAEGFDIGKTTIFEKINEKRNISAECFIRQEYEYGERFEYDFGEVVLIIDGKTTKAYLAVITLPASNFRWAYLYHNSKMEVFLDSQVRFFEMVHGSFKEGVYDNMKNVVSRFIGKSEKELNKQLIKLAIYYGFDINVTNCFSGNEKGSVEEAVKFVRNKVFAIKYEFSLFEEACDYLNKELIKLNKDSFIEEEKKHLTPYRPRYETADILSCSVNKYSFIQIDTNFYSVPDYLVDKKVLVKKYPNDIYVYYKQENVAHHKLITGKKKTCVNIMHYLDTFVRKPGALRNSAALISVPRLKDIFNQYYKDNPKTFINMLKDNSNLSIDELVEVLSPIERKEKLNNWIEDETVKQLSAIASLFMKGNENNEILH